MPCFPVFEDNQGALQLSKNPVLNSNSKYINVRHHFLRKLVRQGNIIVNHVPSEYQHADILTKVLAFDLFAIHRRFLTNLKRLMELLLLLLLIHTFSVLSLQLKKLR